MKILIGKIISDYYENHTKHINTLCGKNAELLNALPGGTQSNHCTLKGEIVVS
jgi:hypothetical protein